MVYDFSTDDPALYDKSSGRITSNARYWIRYFKRQKGWVDVNCCLHTLDNRIICPTGLQPAVLLPGEDLAHVEYVDNYEAFGIECSKARVDELRAEQQQTPFSPFPLLASLPQTTPPPTSVGGEVVFSEEKTSRVIQQQPLPTESVLALSKSQTREAEVVSAQEKTYQTQITNIQLSTSVIVIAKQSSKRAQLIVVNAGVNRVWLNTIPNFTAGTGIPVQAAGGQLKLTKTGGLDICSAQLFGVAEAATNLVVIEVLEVD